MRWWFKYVIVFIVFVQCGAFVWLGCLGYKRIISNRNVLGSAIIVPINKNSLKRSPNTQLPYYFDLPSSQTIISGEKWLPQPVTYTYNEDGLNDRFDYPLEKPQKTFRIVVMGDSFAYGLFVNTGYNFSELLEDKLNATITCARVSKYDIINIGVPGYDIRYALQRYKDKGNKYNPDLIIWFMRDENFYMNSDLYLGRAAYYKTQLEATGAAQRLHVAVDDPYAASRLSFKENLDAYTALNREKQLQYINPETSALEFWRTTYNPKMLILTTSHNENKYKQYMENFALENSGTWYHEVDNIETFDPYDYHPDVKGHKKIAESLYTFLSVNNLLPCVR